MFSEILYKLLVFAEIKAFGEVGGAVWDFFFKGDFRTQFGIAAFEIRLMNYLAMQQGLRVP